jgi:hypothetical protein
VGIYWVEIAGGELKSSQKDCYTIMKPVIADQIKKPKKDSREHSL